MAIVTTSNNGIGNTGYLHSIVNGQSFIVNTIHSISKDSNIVIPILKSKKYTRGQLEIFVLSVGYLYNMNGQKIQVNSFKDLPKGVYIIQVSGESYEYYK